MLIGSKWLKNKTNVQSISKGTHWERLQQTCNETLVCFVFVVFMYRGGSHRYCKWRDAALTLYAGLIFKGLSAFKETLDPSHWLYLLMGK